MDLLAKIRNKLTGPPDDENINQRHSVVKSTLEIKSTAQITSSKIYGEVQIGDFAKINEAVIRGKVRIGGNTSIWGPNINIYSLHNFIEIGKFCSIARNVSMQEYNHDYKKCSTYFMLQNIFNEPGGIYSDTVSDGKIVIGNDVWIADSVKILSGAVIEDGAVIGANSVVRSRIPAYAIAVGSPAKVVSYRFEEDVIAKLLKIKWWDWSLEKIRKNKNLFTGELTHEKLNAVIK